MTTAKQVANTFITIATEGGEVVTHMKLQALVYYAFSWWAAHHEGVALFEQDIEAWRHGPVIRSLWQAFGRYRDQPLRVPASEWALHNGDLALVVPRVQDPEVLTYLRDVWTTYRPYSDIQMCNMTHVADEPWATVRAMVAEDMDQPIMPVAIIAKTFGEKLGRSRAAA